MKRKKKDDSNDAVLCEHANEVPAVCPCKDDCYCKSHTCRPRRTMKILKKSACFHPKPIEERVADIMNNLHMPDQMFYDQCVVAAMAKFSGDNSAVVDMAFNLAEAMVAERAKRNARPSK